MSFKSIIQSARPPFLLLPITSVLLGASLVVGEVDTFLVILILFAVVLANASVNLLNEYSDFRSGLDLVTVRTPFSGGSGSLVENPNGQKWVLIAGILCTLCLMGIGAYFVYLRGWVLVPFGLFGIVLILSYTDWLNKHPFLCYPAPGIGIGIMMVVGTHFALTGDWTLNSFLVGLIAFFLINNLLLVNQYPDIDADKTVGRNHALIAFGITICNTLYLATLFSSIIILLVLVFSSVVPSSALLALGAQVLGFIVYFGLNKYGKAIGEQPIFLSINVALTLLTPTILACVIYLK